MRDTIKLILAGAASILFLRVIEGQSLEKERAAPPKVMEIWKIKTKDIDPREGPTINVYKFQVGTQMVCKATMVYSNTTNAINVPVDWNTIYLGEVPCS